MNGSAGAWSSSAYNKLNMSLADSSLYGNTSNQVSYITTSVNSAPILTIQCRKTTNFSFVISTNCQGLKNANASFVDGTTWNIRPINTLAAQ